jgi:hypothetical protein
MKKQVKIYLHHDYYEPLTITKKSFWGSLGNAIVSVCYGVGLAIVSLIKLPFLIVQFLFRIPKLLPKVIAQMHYKSARRALAGFVLMVILVASGVHGLTLVASGLAVKGEVLGASDAGIGYLQDAKNALDSQDTASAQANFTKALQQFENSEQTLKSTGLTLQTILAVVPQKQDADRLLIAARSITQAGLKGTELLNLTNSLKLTAVGLSSGPQGQTDLIQAQSLLNDIATLSQDAAENINQVSITSIPENYRPTFLAAQDTAKLYLANAQSLKEVSSLLFDLLLGQKNVLIVFQNNNELRANGGFMGTVGNAKLENGSLTSLDIRSVYDWDGQLKERILPPQPMYAVNDRWFMRDSNWFANFPTSASRIGSLFEKTGGETPDLIVTMTPEVIIDMLERTGPITLPKYNITINAENFVETTQTATSVTYDKELNQPKQFLADFYPLLMEKLGSSESGGSMAFLEIFQQNLFQKNILLYARNAELQKKIADFNWGGEVRNTDRDYLSIVNSNLGGTKTDRFLTREINLKSTVASDGKITNTLQYTIHNPLPKTEGLQNKSFVRVLVPEGSTLQSSSGFDNYQLPQLPTETNDYVLDPIVQDWQKQVKQDTSTGIYIGTEAGKTWFGSWLEVAGGESKTITLSYVLPFKIGKLDRHSLLIQKQAGVLNTNLNYELDFNDRRSLWNSSTSNLDHNVLHYNQSLIADTFIGTVLEKP